MARPPKTGLDWFQHETDASTDEKIEAMRSLFGNDGYAFFFICLERIYRTSNQEIDLSDEATRKILCGKVGVKMSRFDRMVEAAIARGLFDPDSYHTRGVLTSDAIRRRAARFLEKRVKVKLNNGGGNAPDMDGFGGGNSPETTAESGDNVPALSRDSTVQHSTVRENARTRPETPAEAQELRNAELLVDKAVEAYHLPTELREPILAWIEIHDNRLPSQHDCRAIMTRCADHSVEAVTIAIRRMGNAGQKPITKLDEYLGEVATRKASAASAPPVDAEAEAAERAAREYYARNRKRPGVQR